MAINPEEQEKQPQRPGTAVQILIEVSTQGQINVRGFPGDMTQSLRILSAAQELVVNFFVKAAMEGRMKNNNQVEESRIIKPANMVNVVGRG